MRKFFFQNPQLGGLGGVAVVVGIFVVGLGHSLIAVAVGVVIAFLGGAVLNGSMCDIDQ